MKKIDKWSFEFSKKKKKSIKVGAYFEWAKRFKKLISKDYFKSASYDWSENNE